MATFWVRVIFDKLAKLANLLMKLTQIRESEAEAMKTVNMHDAKTQLSRLVRDVLSGKRVQIARRGTPVVELHPLNEDEIVRVPGLLKGKIRISDDFDAPSEEIDRLFESGLEPGGDQDPSAC